MNINLIAMLLGVFVVPILLLWMGHKMRRRSVLWHRAFWGAVAGHMLALLIGGLAAMFPPEGWTSSDIWRGVLGIWSFMLFPILGATTGVLRKPYADQARQTKEVR